MFATTVNFLNRKLRGSLENKLFKILTGSLILMNAVALAPQVRTAFIAPSVEGISLTMWFLFLAIQVAMVFEGIRVRSTYVFWAMLISAFESTAIIVAVLIRG